MRHLKTQAIILKRRNVGEADRILTVLSEKAGKISIKAAGVRKITSRRSSHIELLNYSQLSLYKGRGMNVLIEAQTMDAFSEIKDNLRKTGYAYYICELVDGLCPENQENSAIFQLLKETLTRLSLGSEIKTLIHDFEVTLLSLLGFYPNYQVAPQFNTTAYIEQILEKKLKTRQILLQFI